MFERTRSFLHRLASGRRQSADDDRRTWDRLPSERETIIRTHADGAVSLTARILDVSRGGIRMIVTQPLNPGDMIHVELPSLKGEPVTSVLACAVHVQHQPPTSWLVGCNFATELSDADLQALGAKRARPAE